ncbi:hypothetical protein AMAG_10504 [Allomyces macrogynus ATCC 38327]|uniref:4'-phosphopantetheinyl transferase domain-containing protein n=1 Tax=Allomyces macrogynus (strain ATCC 38327) TaxID=578462 RepID=A0A0L0SUY0_ALLM3|nr:hypothetical protein AMAG_10504 [Allomyces macrogynus ATCC 38327]|eukprot:KNE66271.1 hypothetical protein AMAG_10504 [Allomyces macrogynus ATCC 38327]
MNTRRGAAHAEIAAMYGPLMGDREAPVILDKHRDAARAFAFAWAAKEAVTKAWGVGVAVAADAVLRAVQLLDPPAEGVEGKEGTVGDGWRQARDYVVVVDTHHDAVVAHGGPDAVGTPIAVQLFEEVGATRGDAVAVALMRPCEDDEGDDVDEEVACHELDREPIVWVTMSLMELLDRVRELVASDPAASRAEEEEEAAS